MHYYRDCPCPDCKKYYALHDAMVQAIKLGVVMTPIICLSALVIKILSSVEQKQEAHRDD